MGGKGSKNISGGEKGEGEKSVAPPAATAAEESTEPKTSTEAGNGGVGQSTSPPSSTTPERIEGQAQEQCESAADMEKEYVEAVVAKASEFGENE